jgi:hypothetical protein
LRIKIKSGGEFSAAFYLSNRTKLLDNWERGCPHPHVCASKRALCAKFIRAFALIADVDIRAPSFTIL